jgi:hypothetical protein
VNDFDTRFRLVRINELAEPLAFFWVLDDLCPFARIGIDQKLYALFQLLADA